MCWIFFNRWRSGRWHRRRDSDTWRFISKTVAKINQFPAKSGKHGPTDSVVRKSPPRRVDESEKTRQCAAFGEKVSRDMIWFWFDLPGKQGVEEEEMVFHDASADVIPLNASGGSSGSGVVDVSDEGGVSPRRRSAEHKKLGGIDDYRSKLVHNKYITNYHLWF